MHTLCCAYCSNIGLTDWHCVHGVEPVDVRLLCVALISFTVSIICFCLFVIIMNVEHNVMLGGKSLINSFSLGYVICDHYSWSVGDDSDIIKVWNQSLLTV